MKSCEFFPILQLDITIYLFCQEMCYVFFIFVTLVFTIQYFISNKRNNSVKPKGIFVSYVSFLLPTPCFVKHLNKQE